MWENDYKNIPQDWYKIHQFLQEFCVATSNTDNILITSKILVRFAGNAPRSAIVRRAQIKQELEALCEVLQCHNKNVTKSANSSFVPGHFCIQIIYNAIFRCPEAVEVIIWRSKCCGTIGSGKSRLFLTLTCYYVKLNPNLYCFSSILQQSYYLTNGECYARFEKSVFCRIRKSPNERMVSLLNWDYKIFRFKIVLFGINYKYSIHCKVMRI